MFPSERFRLSLLGKGLGFIPTPKADEINTRLDMRLLTNKIVNASRTQFVKQTSPNKESTYDLPNKLRRQYFGKVDSSKDKYVNDTAKRMETHFYM